MSDEQRRERRKQVALRQRERQYALAAQYRNDLVQLREALSLAEHEGKHQAARRLRNRITYRERVIARQKERAE